MINAYAIKTLILQNGTHKSYNQGIKKMKAAFEYIVGILVLGLIILFCIKLFGVNADYKNEEKYTVKAKFINCDGILKGSKVKMSGVMIGEVSRIELNNDYDAIVWIKVQKNVKIPKDSEMMILTSGFLGSKYLNISPGFLDDYMKENDIILKTRPAMNFENLMGQFVKK